MRITLDKEQYCCTTSSVNGKIVIDLYQDDLRCFTGIGQSHYHALQNVINDFKKLKEAKEKLT